MALAKMNADSTPSEFGGVPGVYGNVDSQTVVRETGKVGSPYAAGPLAPHQERMSLTQTNPAVAESLPAYGIGGAKVA